MSDDRKQVERILTIMDMIAGVRFGITLQELHTALAERGFHVNPRTVRRDVEVLQSIGLPLETTPAQGRSPARYRFKSGSRINPFFSVTAHDLWALHLLHQLTRQVEAAASGAILQDFLRKVEDKLGPSAGALLKELCATQGVATTGVMTKAVPVDVLETLRAACAEEQVVNVTYASANSRSVRMRRLGPQFIFFAQNSFYLVAEDLEAGDLKTFAVTRMSGVEMLDESYTARAKADPEAYFAHSMGIFCGEVADEAVLRFKPHLAPFIQERRWHASQEIANEADGSCRLTLRVAITPDLVRWILSWGADIEVLATPALMEKVRETARAIESLYPESVKNAG